MDFKVVGFEIWVVGGAGICGFWVVFGKMFSKLLVMILQSVSKKTS